MTLSGSDIQRLRQKLGDVEVAKLVGVGFRHEMCAGDGICVRAGDHKDHGWWDQFFIGDMLNCKKEKGKDGTKLVMGDQNVPLRYWNFLIAYGKTKNFDKAVEWVKEKAFGLDGEPMDLRITMEADTYSQIFKTLGVSS